jgi:SsrA-binding protein
MPPKGTRAVATNRRARHEYEVLDTFEAGIMLRGSEVKSLRDAKLQIADAFVRVHDGAPWLYGMHISPYSHSFGADGHDPDRRRKLLLHARQIRELADRVEREKLTIIPLSVYFKDGRAKVEIALARGRQRQDKRRAIAERDAAREAERAFARANKYR